MERYSNPIYSIMFKEYNDVVTTDEICEMLHCCRQTCYQLISEGKLKNIGDSRLHKVPKVFVIDYVLGLSPYLGPLEQKNEGEMKND